ncbi:NAD(P)-binding protein [Annulohypoxylon truncatum]|uniref:NAD(P)-binding protein n=1 Tax=Annulohypoxylon truncatum TaxID=327061 RepID=UPI002007AF04|nr:NAD(P)-binding protein [Annulohypoxylon truncatum]KAI1207153.1 NAD(P)-binding protein [Annulohypoxylon truncatum]
MITQLPSKILIIGATGGIGKYITNAIVSAEPRIGRQISIFTSQATATSPAKQDLLFSWKSKGASIITGDLNNSDDIKKAYSGVDTVISCLGRNVLASQIELLKLAEESNDVQWFFPSEYGTDIEYDASSKDEKPHQTKLRVREFIREHVKRVKCTYVVTGPYLDMYLTLIPTGEDAGGYDVKSKRAVIVGSGDEKVGLTTMPDVGKLVVAALRHPDASMGKVLKVQSLVTTPNAILEEFERQTGTKWTVDHTTNEKLREVEKEKWDANNPLAALYTLRRIWAEGGTLYEKTDNEIIGLTPGDMEPLSAVVKRAVNGEGY